MNNKMAKNISRINLKNKISKQEEQKQNHGYREHFAVGRRVWRNR